MEKLVYLLFEETGVEGGTLRSSLLEKVAPVLQSEGASQLRINVDDDAVAGGNPIRRSDPPIRAMVSFWLQDSDDRVACERALADASQRLAGYLVTESRPLLHETKMGGRSPGMNQVTCIARRQDLAYEEFIRIWHGDHKLVAVETQSTTGYVRNEILRPLTPDAPQWDAIVEETFPIGALTDLKVFYDADDEEELKRRMQRMVESCQRFLDFGPLECTPMSEYVLG